MLVLWTITFIMFTIEGVVINPRLYGNSARHFLDNKWPQIATYFSMAVLSYAELHLTFRTIYPNVSMGPNSALVSSKRNISFLFLITFNSF